ncbi:hypothetical protein [Persephonella sp.]|uniref:hypothetical protein n=1 Tax=Persephonella sp. TaxID=2060922 RepID=UPI00260F245A|nr:hypothetical protein [Persephonella sp.]
MKKVFLLFFVLVFYSYGQEIAIKTPVIRNLPDNYKKVFLDFFIKNFDGVQKYSPDKKAKYIIRPYISSIAGSYNLCIDIFKDQKLAHIVCISAENGEQLADKVIFLLPQKINFLHPKKEIPVKKVNLQLITPSDNYGEEIKVVSHNGDTIVDYKKVIPSSTEPTLNFNKVIINIDTALLDNKQAAKLMEYLLKGYRIKGILIIKNE